MKGSEFAFHYVHLMYYKCHKTNANHSGSCVASPDWIKNKKKTTINLINKKNERIMKEYEKMLKE